MDSNNCHELYIPNLPIIWVIGGPGSGKSTLSDKLAKNHGFHHISAGELLRDEVKSSSSLSKSIRETMKRGELVDVEIMLKLLKKNMAENISHRGYLIEGFPRDASQGQKFEEVIRPVDCILSLTVSEEVMKRRLMKRSRSSKRVDDNEESIIKRFETHRKLYDEILRYFQYKIREVNAEHIDIMYKEAITVLNDMLGELENNCLCD